MKKSAPFTSGVQISQQGQLQPPPPSSDDCEVIILFEKPSTSAGIVTKRPSRKRPLPTDTDEPAGLRNVTSRTNVISTSISGNLSWEERKRRRVERFLPSTNVNVRSTQCGNARARSFFRLRGGNRSVQVKRTFLPPSKLRRSGEQNRTLEPNTKGPLFQRVQLEDEEFCPNPYKMNIMNWSPDTSFHKTEEVPIPEPLHASPYELVVDNSGFKCMLDDLKAQTILGVDLEADDYRSFMGLVTVIQISTMKIDYVIDCFALHDSIHELNAVFTSASILKIFHGARNDVKWLKRDFCVNLLNVFDTMEAAKLLKYADISLAGLLLKFFNIEKHKGMSRRQNWSERPVSPAMINYCRLDTHYLIKLYQILQHQLIDRSINDYTPGYPMDPEVIPYDLIIEVITSDCRLNLVWKVLEMGKRICSESYSVPQFSPTKLLRSAKMRSKEIQRQQAPTTPKVGTLLGGDAEAPTPTFHGLPDLQTHQMEAFTELGRLRYELAQDTDKSTAYVLPVLSLFEIARVMPPTQVELLKLLPSNNKGQYSLVHSVVPQMLRVINSAHTEFILNNLKADVESLVNVFSNIKVLPRMDSDSHHAAGSHETGGRAAVPNKIFRKERSKMLNIVYKMLKHANVASSAELENFRGCDAKKKADYLVEKLNPVILKRIHTTLNEAEGCIEDDCELIVL